MPVQDRDRFLSQRKPFIARNTVDWGKAELCCPCGFKLCAQGCCDDLMPQAYAQHRDPGRNSIPCKLGFVPEARICIKIPGPHRAAHYYYPCNTADIREISFLFFGNIKDRITQPAVFKSICDTAGLLPLYMLKNNNFRSTHNLSPIILLCTGHITPLR